MELPGVSSAPTDEASGAASLTDDPRKWWALAVLLLAQLMLILDIAIVNVAIPSVQRDLEIAPSDVQWVVTAYLLPFGGMLLLGGRVADYTGRKRLFCVAALGFAIASAVGGAAQSEAVLFAARACQGFFGAAMAPALLSMLTLGFPSGKDRNLAFSLYGGVGAAGGALGLVIGGALTQYLTWRWCFLINVPISVLLVLAAIPLLRESKAEGRPHYDVMGGILGTLGLLGLVYGIARAADAGWGSQEVLIPLIAGVVTLIVFVVWEARVSDPLMPLFILGSRARAAGFATIICVYGPPSAMILLLLIYFQGPQGLSPMEAGASFAAIPGAAIFAALATVKLVERVSPRILLGVGSLMGTAALLSFTRLEVDSSYVEDLLPGIVVMGFGTAMAYVAATNIALFGIPDKDTGVASAVMNTVQQVGAALGVAILSTIAASASADYVAEHGPRSINEAIVHGNEEAFLIGTVMMLALTVIAVLLVPPRLRISGDAASADGPEAVKAAATVPLAPGTDAQPALAHVAAAGHAVTNGAGAPGGPKPTPVGGSEDDWRAWVGEDVNSRRLGLRCESIAPGRLVLAMEQSPLVLNADGSTGAALILAAVEHSMGLTAATVVSGEAASTDSFSAQFFRPAVGQLTLRVQVTKCLPQLLRLNADVLDQEGSLCVRCTGSVTEAGLSSPNGSASATATAVSPA